MIFIKFIKFCPILLALLSCLKAKRSPWDMSTPKGLVSNLVFSFLNAPKALPSPKIQAPPPAGSYSIPTFITFSVDIPDAKIYFTLDGTEPSINSFLYKYPVSIWAFAGSGTIPVKMIAIKEGFLNSSVVTTTIRPYQMPPLKTGQTSPTTSYADAHYSKGLVRGYEDREDGTVLDTTTGLLWQKCVKGREGPSCTGTVETLPFADAENYCGSLSLAGEKWRVPTYLELQTLQDYGSTYGVNTSFFPNPPGAIWTSTPHPTNLSNHNAYVNFFHNFVPASTSFAAKTSSLAVLCVSSKFKRDFLPNASNFTDNGDGTVKDKSTGLLWQKCEIGQTWNGTSCINASSANKWNTALGNCNTLNLAGKSWRLPNINELRSILDMTKKDPFLDHGIFTTGISGGGGLWSSTTNAANSSEALLLVAADGRVASNGKSSAYYNIRCVADEL